MTLNWYRRLKLGFDLASSRYYISKTIAPKPPFSITNHTSQLRSTFNNNNNNNQQSLIRVTKDSPSLLKSSHFGSSYGYRCYRKNYDGFLYRLFILTAVHLGVTIIFYGHVETVPYTKRLQFLLMPPDFERKAGVDRFERIKDEYKGKALAVMDPESVRVRKILNDVVEALEIGLMKKHKGVKLPGVYELLGSINSKGLEWEILVVKNDDAAYACCLPGGKFVVFTGLLDRFNTDEEIAAIIAHEVSHVVARHVAEKFTNKYYWRFLVVFLYYLTFEGNYASASSLDLPFSPRMEIEADYIGLMLMAFAGYDPRVAPKVFEKMGQALGDLAFHDYLSKQPSMSRQTRSEPISEFSGIMQEAISIYEEAKVGGVQADT